MLIVILLTDREAWGLWGSWWSSPMTCLCEILWIYLKWGPVTEKRYFVNTPSSGIFICSQFWRFEIQQYLFLAVHAPSVQNQKRFVNEESVTVGIALAQPSVIVTLEETTGNLVRWIPFPPPRCISHWNQDCRYLKGRTCITAESREERHTVCIVQQNEINP